MANCINCGAPSEPSRTKCAYCGTTIAQAPQPQPAQFAQPQGYYQPAYGQPGVQLPPGALPIGAGAPKSIVAAALFAFFLGGLGIHNFYLGYNGKGITQLLLTLLGWPLFMLGPIVAGVWAFVEFILILVRNYPDRWGRPLV